MYFSFVNKPYLILLFIIPFMIFFHFYSLKSLKGKSLKFANFDAIAKVKGIDIYSKSFIPLILNIALVLSLVFALAGLTLFKEMNAASFSYVIAIDSSESMGADDIKPNRITAAKESAEEFVDLLPSGTKIGVISFSGKTYIEQELTDNKDLIKNSINRVDFTEIGGTDVYEAVLVSLNLLRNEENKAMILLSDGQINVGDINDAVDTAVYSHVVLHTFGIGTLEGGKTDFGISKIDENILKTLAYSTKGKFFNVENGEKMKESFREIIPLTRRMGEINLSSYLIIFATLIFIIKYFFSHFNRISI